jgi:hypothetical protein
MCGSVGEKGGGLKLDIYHISISYLLTLAMIRYNAASPLCASTVYSIAANWLAFLLYRRKPKQLPIPSFSALWKTLKRMKPAAGSANDSLKKDRTNRGSDGPP